MRVTAVDYKVEENKPVVQLAGRNDNSERVIIEVEDTESYFYLASSIDIPHDSLDRVSRREEGYMSYDDIPLDKVVTNIPSDVDGIKDSLDSHYEADIPFYRRISVDYNLSGHIRVPDTDRCSIDDIETDVEVDGDEIIEPRIFIADIEVLQDNTSFEEMQETYENTVSHISVWDSQEDKYYALHLDPEGEVSPASVSDELDGHIAGERLSKERDRDIIIRGYDSPQRLLSGFLALVEKKRPDLISGWNFVDFDWDYLLNHLDNFNDLNEHGLSDIGWVNGYQTERKVDCFPAFDQMDAFCEKMTFHEWRSKSLEYVAKSELGVGKIPNISIDDLFYNDRDKLLAYNIMDTMLCVALDRKEAIHEFFYELAELSQVQIYDTFSEMRLVDGYIMSQAGPDEILPSMPDDRSIPENAGGLVLDPSDGVRDWVGVIDLKSLYPSVMITWNISPETIHWYDEETPEDLGIEQYMNVPWLPDADEADGGNFDFKDIRFDVMWVDMSREGLIPKYVKPLFKKRAWYKQKRNQYEPGDDLYKVWDRKQNAVKVIMNSFYGVMSNDYWRLGKYGLGDAVTSAARYALWQGKEVGQDEGYEIYYGDTDSIMLSLADPSEGKEAALTRGHGLEEEVNNRMDECVSASGMPDSASHPFIGDDLHGTDRHCLVYEFEKLYRRFFQAGSKKRYAGSIVWKEGKDVDGEIDMVGFEAQRSDSPELTEQVQPEVVNRILEGQEFSEISEYIRGLIGDIENRDIPIYRVALPSSLGQPLSEYGNTQVSRACRFANSNLDYSWNKGDDPWVYFIDRTPPMTPGTDVVALEWDEDLPEGYELDLDETLDRALKGPLMPILREVNWRWTEVKQGAKTGSASDMNWSADDVQEEQEEDDDGWGW